MRPPRLWRPQPRRALPAVRAAAPGYDDFLSERTARLQAQQAAEAAARLLFAVEPTDRALTEWRPPQRGGLE